MSDTPLITPISPDIVGEAEKFLIYADPGMGKTFSALTLPEPVLFIAIGASNEAKTYYSKQFQKKYGKREILISVAEESTDEKGGFYGTPVGFDNACSILDHALDQEEAGKLSFASIVIDNATILSEFQMNKVLSISYIDAKDKSGTAFLKLREHGIRTPYDSDWGGAMSLMNEFVTWLFQLNKHVALVAHEHKDMIADRKSHSQIIKGVKPLFVGKQRTIIANRFDNVWRFTKNGQFYEARTTPLNSPYDIVAKTRIGGVLDDDYRNPDLSESIQLLQEAAKEAA
jgi:hypothetical protein